MADIFISYARADRETAKKLAAALEAEGFTVWWDRHIEAGLEFSKNIEAELTAATAVIVCWSNAAANSPWVKDEASAAAEFDKLVPICLDGDRPPMGFRQYQALDFQHWQGDVLSPAYLDLVAAMKSRLTGQRVSAPARQEPRSQWERLIRPIAMATAAVMVSAIIAVAVLHFTRPGNPPGVETGLAAAPLIAVAQINTSAGDPALAESAAALRDDIASALSRFSTLAVAAPGEEANAQYRLDATLRQSDNTLRLTARLIDAANEKQVWGETFDRSITDQSGLDIQDDLRDHVVASVADPYGALMRDLQAPVARKAIGKLTPYEAILRHAIYRQRLSAEDHLATRAALERAAEEAPGDSDVFAALAAVTIEEVKHEYNQQPNSKARALSAARRAVELDPDNAYAWFELAEVQYFCQDLGAFRSAAERAVELNPLDTEALAMLGILMGYAGDWSQGREWTLRAMALNPNHPGWYRFSIFFDAYRQGKYEEALQIAERIRQPDYFADAYVRAIAYAQLGQHEAAARAAKDFLALWPGDLISWRENHLGVWMYAQPELQDQIIDGLRKAGLDV